MTIDDRIGQFWKWFDTNKQRTESDAQGMVPEIGRELERIHPDLRHELGIGQPMEMFISAGGLKEMIPYVERTVELAPSIEGWNVVAFLQPKQDSSTVVYEGVTLMRSQVKWTGSKDGDLLDVVVFIDGLDDQRRNAYVGAAFVMLDSVIGEYAVMTEVGRIEFRPISDAPQDAKPIESLREEIAPPGSS
ncbi:MAG: hypothetical protein WD716_10225 [Fimbriimonadaceae bacterium]